MPLVDATIDDDGVGLLILDDPARRNAMTPEMVGDIAGAFDWFEHDERCGAVVVTGRAPAFCAGADLSHLGAATPDQLEQIYEGFLRAARSPLPTVAAVNGAAVGAGVNLALACDVRLVGASGRFDTRFVRLGIHPGGGHTWLLQRLAGPQTTHAMVTFGQVVGAADAVRLGLAWQAFDDDELLDAARSLAGRAASAPRELVLRIKETVAEVAPMDDHDDAVRHELVAQVWSMGRPAFRERIDGARAEISGDGR